MKEVPESWWHRTLKVLLCGCVLIVALIAGVVAHDSARDHVTDYSWEPNYKAMQGASECSVTLYPSIGQANVACGSMYRAEEILNRMVATGYIAKPEIIPTPRSEYSDAATLKEILNFRPVQYRSYYVYSSKGVINSGFQALLSILIASLIAWSIYRVAVYIVHGAGAKVVRR